MMEHDDTVTALAFVMLNLKPKPKWYRFWARYKLKHPLPPGVINMEWWKEMPNWKRIFYRISPKWWTRRELRLMSKNPKRFMENFREL